MRARSVFVCLFALTVLAAAARAQAPAAPAAPANKDALNRETPRGTVLGFLAAAGRGDDERASLYLDTRSGPQGTLLSHQLFVVLDARLPARLLQISDEPGGSQANPERPDQELIGTISFEERRLDVFVERVTIAGGARVWLFSATTLGGVPRAYEEVTQGWGESAVGRSLNAMQLRRARLLEWLVLVVIAALAYAAAVFLNRLLTRLVRRWRPRTTPGPRAVLSLPLRLLVVSAALQWFLSTVSLSLLVRQVGSSLASLAVIVAVVWLLIAVNGVAERLVRTRVPAAGSVAGAALVHLLRRCADVVMVVIGLLATLRLFAIDPTPALAGLGVGGIAIALAAQKTLENVIAGASLVFDQAVRVGDVLKMGEVVGTVEHIGLRSTRIRTPDRTIVTVPNSLIASATLETLSARDKYWFHPVLGLRYETTPAQLRAVLDGLQQLLATHPAVDPESVRVRFIHLAASSLDVELFAYLFARDWPEFLALQEQLLVAAAEVVARSGTAFAFPSQTMYIEDTRVEARAAPARETS